MQTGTLLCALRVWHSSRLLHGFNCLKRYALWCRLIG